MPRKNLLTLFPLLLVWSTLAWSQPPQSAALIYAYHQLRAESATTFSTPFAVRSQEDDKRLSAEIFSVLDQPLDVVAQALTNIENWCVFMPLNLNVKSCTYSRSDNVDLLTLYVGRKFYQEPEDAYTLSYEHQTKHNNENGFNVVMVADEGPMGTKDYLIEIDAIPLNGQTLLRINMAYNTSWMSKLASSAYLATMGRDKLGFSVEGKGVDGQPIFIRGPQAVIERNAMRYYLAMKAYLETEQLIPEKRLEARIIRWFEMTEEYSKQLYEIEREEYLQAKRKEWINQAQLQALENKRLN
jgi:hypothetical protein